MDYTIARIRISIPREFTTGAFGRALAPFATLGAGRADLTLGIAPIAGPGAEYRELDTFEFQDADAICRFGHDEAGYLLEMMPRGGAAARFRMQHGAAEALCDITSAHNPALLRFGLWTVYNLTALTRQAVAVHTSVIVADGQGALFLGESGTGKSTHTRLWREHITGATLLNDDSPILRIDNDGVRIYGSPWSGKTPCYRNESYPVRGVVRLSQAPENRMRRLSPLEAIGALLPSCPPQFARDSQLQDAVCGVVSSLLKQVPAYHLACRPDAEAAQLSHRTLFGQ